MKYSNDKSVVFDNGSHTYFKKDKKLTSVTTFIDKFKNKFDSDYHSKRIALKENKTQEEVLSEWKEKAFRSTEIGTAIHKIFEDYTNGNYSIINENLSFDYLPLKEDYIIEFESKKNGAISFINDLFLKNRLTPVYSELIVYNDYLAGQIDSICKDNKGNFYIIDFKTNKSIDTFSYHKKMKEPFYNVNDSNYYHYCLQLSIYKRLCDFDIKAMFLIHITENDYQIIECEDIFDTYKIHFESLIYNHS